MTSSHELPNSKLGEPTDAPRIRFGVRDVFKALDEQDPYMQHLDHKLLRAQGIRARNWRRVTEVREAVQKGERPDFSAENLAEYPVPEWLKQDYRPYTVCMANRGNSTSFPEFEGMTFSERQELARQLYFCLENHRGEPIYSKSAMEQAYRSLYGRHEPDGFHFKL